MATGQLETDEQETNFDKKIMTDKQTSNQNLFRIIALIVVLIGAIVSLFFMFNAGSEQKSILLLTLFTGWVLSPFAGLLFANKISNRWTVSSRAFLYWLMVVLTILSLVAYSGVLTPTDTKPAFMFLVVPFCSNIILTTIILINKKTK